MQKITRRLFGKYLTLAPLLSFVLSSGFTCSGDGSAVFADIMNWTKVAGIAIDGIVTVVGAFLPLGYALIINAIKAFLLDLGNAVVQYQADTNPADKATWLAKIRTILSDIVSNFNDFLNSLNLGNNPIEAVVAGLADVILAAIAGFQGQLPATGALTLSRTYRVNHKTYTYVPKFYKNVKSFEADYNAVAVSKGYANIVIH